MKTLLRSTSTLVSRLALVLPLVAVACGEGDDENLDAQNEALRWRINGACGSAALAPTSVRPTSQLCRTGLPSAVMGSGPFTWSCRGTGGGKAATCSAPLANATPPPPANPPPTNPPPSSGAPNATRQCSPVSGGTFEFYSLPATTGLPSGTSFLTDFAQHPQAGGFSGIQAVDKCRIHADGFLTSHGKPAVRIEVNPGDDPLDLGTERAELLAMQDASGNVFDGEGATGATLYYATSYYFPTTWDGTFLRGDGDSWSFVNQFYGWGGLAAGRRDVGAAQTYWFDGASGAFSDGGNITLGHWTDFVFKVNYASGAYTFYRREEGQTKFVVVMNGTSAGAKNTEYYKEGLYRGPDVNGRTDVLWIGPASRGSSFAAVEQASFGTSGGF